MWAWGPLEADFWQYYRIDLQQEGFSDKLSWRKFLVFFRGLPSESAFRRWYEDKSNRSFAEWTENNVFKEVKKVPVGGRV